MRAFFLLTLCAVLCAQPKYDILLKGGHLIDPKNKINAPRDVAIKDGKVAAVAASIPAAEARKTVAVNGLYVVPGLIDLHAHVFSGTTGHGLAGGAPGVEGAGEDRGHIDVAGAERAQRGDDLVLESRGAAVGVEGELASRIGSPQWAPIRELGRG